MTVGRLDIKECKVAMDALAVRLTPELFKELGNSMKVPGDGLDLPIYYYNEEYGTVHPFFEFVGAAFIIDVGEYDKNKHYGRGVVLGHDCLMLVNIAGGKMVNHKYETRVNFAFMGDWVVTCIDLMGGKYVMEPAYTVMSDAAYRDFLAKRNSPSDAVSVTRKFKSVRRVIAR